MTQSSVVFNGLTEKQLTVLVVDDGEMNRRMLARFFQNIGHTCVTAGNGVEAVAYCESHIPDVILMDVMMPIMDGYEATIAIRKLLGETWVPIIFLSGLDEHDSLIKGLEVGGMITSPNP